MIVTASWFEPPATEPAPRPATFEPVRRAFRAWLARERRVDVQLELDPEQKDEED